MSPIAHPHRSLADPSRSGAPRGPATGPVPRYTAYPTADRFVEAFGSEDLQHALWQRANGAVVGGCAPLVIHVRVPSACGPGRIGRYLQSLGGEISLVASMLGSARAASRLDLGGPALLRLSRSELARLVDSLRQSFCFEGAPRMSVEVDTGPLVEGRLAHLRQLGFGELVVDTTSASASPAAGAPESAIRLVASARRLGFDASCVRLPEWASTQGRVAFRSLLRRMLAVRPDRLALPSPSEALRGESPAGRADRDDETIALLEAAGYVRLGLEDFALRTHGLAIAREQGRLFLGLGGFDDSPCADRIALGAGAVGQVGASYYQNLTDVACYEAAIAGGRLPVERGLALARDDLARRSVIHALVCQGRVDFESIRLAHLIDPQVHFACELAEMRSLAEAGLATMDDAAIELTAAGRRSANAVAAVFDRYRRARARRNECAALQ